MACIDAETSKAWSEADVCAREKKPLVDKINQLTDMLCWILSTKECREYVPLREDIDKWWEAHRKTDRLMREKKEKEDKELKQSALAKLTAEEKRVLGL